MTYASRFLLVVVVGFLAYSLPPYLTGGTRVPATFAWHYPLLVAHVLLGGVAMLAVLPQLWPRLRARRPGVHRTVGRIYVLTAVPAALCAMPIGVATPFGPMLAVSNAVLATLWLYFTVNGSLSARRRDFARHRRHMICSATLALSIITNRIWGPVLYVTLYPLRDSIFAGDEEAYWQLVAGAGGLLGWTIPLGAVHWWLSRRPAVSALDPAGSR